MSLNWLDSHGSLKGFYRAVSLRVLGGGLRLVATSPPSAARGVGELLDMVRDPGAGSDGGERSVRGHRGLRGGRETAAELEIFKVVDNAERLTWRSGSVARVHAQIAVQGSGPVRPR